MDICIFYVDIDISRSLWLGVRFTLSMGDKVTAFVSMISSQGFCLSSVKGRGVVSEDGRGLIPNGPNVTDVALLTSGFIGGGISLQRIC